ncbi:MAG: VF530 family protein [Chthoniobacterales bacterium]
MSDATPSQPNNPLHGITLEMMLTELVAHYGWEELGQIVKVRCFLFDPSIKSSLTFLRRTPWARTKVENLYLDYLYIYKSNASNPPE